MLLLTKIAREVAYNRSSVVKVPPQLMLQVISNTQQYHKFVPCCARSVITQPISQHQNYTELTVSFKGMADISFTSHVTIMDEQEKAVVRSICRQKPMKYLESIWQIEKEGQQQSKVNYTLDFEFVSPLYQMTTSMFLDVMGRTMMDTFIAKALQIHTKSTPQQAALSEEPKEQPQIVGDISVEKALQELLANDPKINQLYKIKPPFRKAVDAIVLRLSGTSHVKEKLAFQIHNLLAHLPPH